MEKITKKEQEGVYLVKMRVQIATRPNLARLRELCGKLLPYFPINRGRSERKKCLALLVIRDHLKLVKKIVSVKKIQAEALP